MKVEVRNNNVDKALRILKKKLQQDGFFNELRDILFAKVRYHAVYEISVKVLTHLHKMSLRFHLERQTGSIIRDLERGTQSLSSLINYIIVILMVYGFKRKIGTMIYMRLTCPPQRSMTWTLSRPTELRRCTFQRRSKLPQWTNARADSVRREATMARGARRDSRGHRDPDTQALHAPEASSDCSCAEGVS